jgi:archaetidylinositol phosphate synthase
VLGVSDERRSPASNAKGVHERQYRFALAGFERWALPRLAAALPRWVLPDDLTVLGLLASTGIGAAYILTNRDPAWLWAVNGLLIVQWFGDSLDGTLARVRQIERPRYGFYLDHLTDAYSTFAIGLGLGLSPYMLLSVALANVIAYLVMSINVYLETHVFGEFSFGYGLLGPTEVRVVLIALNATALIWGTLPFSVWGEPATMFDIAGAATFLAMSGLLLVRVARNLRTLGRLEPPASRR